MPEEEFASSRAIREQRAVYNVETGVLMENENMIWTNVNAAPVAFPDWKVVVITMDITMRKQMEEEINSQSEMLKIIFDHLPVMITYFNKTGNIKMINHDTVKKLGWSFEEWQTEDILKKCYPDPKVYKEAFDFMISKPPGWKDFKTTTKYSTLIDTTWMNIQLPNGVSLGIGQDITERKKIETELLLSKQMLQTVLDTIPASVFWKDTDLLYLGANRSFLNTIGMRFSEEITGKSYRTFFLFPLVFDRLRPAARGVLDGVAPPTGLCWAMGSLLLAGITASLLARGRWRPALLGGTMAALILGATWVAAPIAYNILQAPLHEFAMDARRTLGPDDPVVVYGLNAPSIVFYAERRVKPIGVWATGEVEAAVRELTDAGRPAVVITRSALAPRLTAIPRLALRKSSGGYALFVAGPDAAAR